MDRQKYRVKISTYDRELILKYVLAIDGNLAESLKKKRSRNGEVTIELTQKEVNEIAGWIAMEANHTKSRQLAEDLNALCDHLESVEREIRMGY